MKIEELRQSCIDSYATFCEIMQDDGLVGDEHEEWFDPIHEHLCNWIQQQIEETWKDGLDCKLNIVMPRGSLKSTIVTKYLSAWLTIRDKNFRSLLVSATASNAERKQMDVKGLFDTHPTFRSLFPELLPTRDCKWTDKIATVKRTQAWPEGTFESGGLGTKLTGRHYNAIFEDDTCAPDESENKLDITIPSAETLERAIGWHKQATPLLVPKGKRLRVIVTTRWADDDIVDYVRKHEDYRYFDMPAMDEEEKNCYFKMFYNKEKLAEIKTQVGPYMFSCLYLNRPMDATLRVFKKDWFNYCNSEDIETESASKVFRTIAIDPAISEKDESCETAITEILHVQRGDKAYQYWIRDFHGHLTPSETVKKAIDWAEEKQEDIQSVIVEANAYQAALKYALRDELANRDFKVDIVPIISKSTKSIRIEGMQPKFAAGRIFFCEGLTEQVESQLLQFPHGRLVDVIDAFSLHQKYSKGYKHSKRERVIKKKAGENTGEAILDQVRARSKKRSDKGVLSEYFEHDSMDYMSTGLGERVDDELFYKSYIHGRN